MKTHSSNTSISDCKFMLILIFRYLHDPVLFERDEIGKVKFDIRYILLLHTVKPLQVYAYNRFWLRFANQEFELKDLDVYEKHFTVMNYKDTHLEQVKHVFLYLLIIFP